MNRGLARRTVFEDRECVRFFLSCLARVVRKGLLEVHAYCVMTTHFHLLVRSPTGELARALQLAQNRYVRWFNRRVRRDGPLFRGRFLSRMVDSLQYRRLLVRYIDANPVVAKMVERPLNYPHGSARHYRTARGPLWLERTWIEQDALQRTGTSRFTSEVYQLAFGTALSEAAAEMVEARLVSNVQAPDPLDELVASAPEAVGRWMKRKAKLADGTQPGLPCASGGALWAAWKRRAEARCEWQLPRGTRGVDVWPVMIVGLLRDLAGSSWAEIQQRTGGSSSSIQRRYQSHRAWMADEEAYVAVVGELGAEGVPRPNSFHRSSSQARREAESERWTPGC